MSLAANNPDIEPPTTHLGIQKTYQKVESM